MVAQQNWYCLSCGRKLAGRKQNAIRHSKSLHGGDSRFYRSDLGPNLVWHTLELEQIKGRMSIRKETSSNNYIWNETKKRMRERLINEMADAGYPLFKRMEMLKQVQQMYSNLPPELRVSFPDTWMNSVTPVSASAPSIGNIDDYHSAPPTTKIDPPERDVNRQGYLFENRR